MAVILLLLFLMFLEATIVCGGSGREGGGSVGGEGVGAGDSGSMPQSACPFETPITVYSYGFLFNCTTVLNDDADVKFSSLSAWCAHSGSA